MLLWHISYGKSITTLSKETPGAFRQCGSKSGKLWPRKYCPLSLIRNVFKITSFSGFKGRGEGQSEGQASQKASGVNRTGTSWWNSSILLTYDDMIDFPSECSNVGLSSCPHLLVHPASICPPTHPPSRQLMDKASVCLVAWCGVDEWKNNCNEWRVKSESAIFRLSISLQENKLTTNRRSRFRAAGWWEHSECQHHVTTLTRQWKAQKGNFFEGPDQSFKRWM